MFRLRTARACSRYRQRAERKVQGRADRFVHEGFRRRSRAPTCRHKARPDVCWQPGEESFSRALPSSTRTLTRTRWASPCTGQAAMSNGLPTHHTRRALAARFALRFGTPSRWRRCASPRAVSCVVHVGSPGKRASHARCRHCRRARQSAGRRAWRARGCAGNWRRDLRLMKIGCR